MPVRIQNITDETRQRHTITGEQRDVILTLVYHPQAQFWQMDVEYGDLRATGVQLVVDAQHIPSLNAPVDFVVRDAQGGGVDPFRRADFAEGRCELYMLTSEDMEQIRGQPVPE